MFERSETADPLSDILFLLKPRSIACGAVDAGDVCVRFPIHDGVKCHAVMEGEAWLSMDGIANPYHVVAGDLLILPHGRAYTLSSDPKIPPEDYRAVLARGTPGHVLTYNGGGRATIISVAFTVDKQNAHLLLRVLPSVLHLRSDVDRLRLNQSLTQMMAELRHPQKKTDRRHSRSNRL